ncbi:integrin alpha-1 [Cololabis saira]|uniref:integrin alpha-1 n=1 Tax=Cololabis saira TaxID=129043 RepID=UPI002AD3735E|nr:integrin alpha-1 [Cololabis saira]
MLGCSRDFHLTAVLAVALVACVLCFNVDQKNGLSFNGPLEDMFGYTVQQFQNDEGKWVLIGSPLSGQPKTRTGDVYKCPVRKGDNTCIKLELPKNTTIPNLREVKENMTMGTTLVTNPSGGFLACGPQYGYMCGEQQYIVGVCANVSSSFQISNSFSPAVRECSKNLDIVIVLDGSNSIYPWSSIVEFLIRFLGPIEIGPKQSQVGIVSYGKTVSHLVNLSQFDNTGELVKFVEKLPQHTGIKTNTFLAVETARKEAFMLERGARPGMKKVMVIVTDGESHDSHDLPRVIDNCEKDGIERFGIAVLGDYGRQNKSAADVHKFIREIENISSQPLQDHFFNVSDELALVHIVDTLGSKIFALEATTGNYTSSFEMEMSQTGFSAHTTTDGVLLGAVGAYNWNGTVVMEIGGKSVDPGKTQFYDPNTEAGYEGLAGYLGYDVQSASTPNGVLYITGAPRYNHTGRVVIYRLNEENEENEIVVSQILKGEQIGSYFGSVLQTIDINDDSYTDLLLVGAPMYMGSERGEQGQVYVYKLSQAGLFEHQFTLKPKNQSCCAPYSASCTNKNEPCGARFGTAIAAVTDLNLDGFNDVAIGAPFENDHRGAVYIYHGDKTSLKEEFVQHIPAGGDGKKVKFFGQSIHGIMDLNGDGITDVTIGGLGGASLFWSRDVAELHANMSFNPVKINLQQSQHQCEHGGRKSACVVTKVCFRYHIKSDTKDLNAIAEIRYTLTLDALRSKARAAFIDVGTDKSDRKITKTFKIKDRQRKCLNETFMMSARLDFRDPLLVSLDFELADKDQGPVLDESIPRSINKTIPLVDCGGDERCITDLALRAEASVKRMVIKVNTNDKIDVNINIKNKRDNAYNTKVTLTFTPNINYVKVEPETACTLNGTRLECAVGYPFLGSNAEENFKVKFETNPKKILDKIQINVTATSDSEELSMSDNTVQISIPVKYQPAVIFTVSPVNEHIVVKDGEKFNPELNDTKMIGENLDVSYTVDRSGDAVTPPLELTVTYPRLSPLGNILLLPRQLIVTSEVECKPKGFIKSDITVPKTKKETLSVFLLQCEQSTCETFSCSIPAGKSSQVNITFKMWKPTFIKGDFSSLYMMVNATLSIENTHLFELGSNDNTRDVTIQVSKETVSGIPIWIIIVSILLGLLILALVIFILWKLGFFKRKSPDYSKEDAMD